MSKFRTVSSSANSGNNDSGNSSGQVWGHGSSVFSYLTCGLAPHTLVVFLSVVDIAKGIGAIAWCIYVYVQLRINGVEKIFKIHGVKCCEEAVHLPMWAQRGVIFLPIFYCLMSLAFSVLLFSGAQQRHYPKLRYWYIYQLTVLLLFIPVHIWTYVHGLLLPEKPHKIICEIFVFIFFIYVWQGYHLYVTALLITDITSPDADNRKRYAFSKMRKY